MSLLKPELSKPLSCQASSGDDGHDTPFSATLARPYVSNDNPYSEAQFKTLKYRPNSGFHEQYDTV